MSRSPRATGRDRRSRVAAKEWVTPQMLRLTLVGDTEDFRDQGGDQHVALKFYPPEAIIPASLELSAMQELHQYAHTTMRRYTVRRWDPVTGEVDIDFAIHEPAGLATAWALAARTGDELIWWGPTPAWQIAPESSEVLLVGDETALPAIDAILGELGPQVRARVVIEVADESGKAYLDHHAGAAEMTWVVRSGAPGDGSPDLLRAVRAAAVPSIETFQVWGAAEFSTVSALRQWFHGAAGMTRQQAFLVTYWTHGRAQDARYDARGLERTRENRRRNPQRARLFVRGIDATP